MTKKAQVSVEYMMLFGFLMVFIIALLLISTSIQESSKCVVVQEQMERTAKSISRTTEEIYYHGPPSRTEFSVVLPKEVNKDPSFGYSGKTFYFSMPYYCKWQNNFTEDLQVPTGGAIVKGEGSHLIRIEARTVRQCPSGPPPTTPPPTTPGVPPTSPPPTTPGGAVHGGMIEGLGEVGGSAFGGGSPTPTTPPPTTDPASLPCWGNKLIYNNCVNEEVLSDDDKIGEVYTCVNGLFGN
jgi:hypothetical protein